MRQMHVKIGEIGEFIGIVAEIGHCQKTKSWRIQEFRREHSALVSPLPTDLPKLAVPDLKNIYCINQDICEVATDGKFIRCDSRMELSVLC